MQTPQTKSHRPIRLGAMIKPERGKFYFFSPTEGILVIRPWPVLKAWRKTPKRAFRQVRADISLAEPPRVLPAFRRSEPPRNPILPPSEEELRALLAKWPTDVTDNAAEQPRMIRGYAYGKRWHAESELRHREVARAFAETFPADLRQFLARFGSRQWHLAKLAQLDGGLDLLKSNPGLAFCLASSWVFKRSAKPWRTVRRLLRLRRRDAAAWLGFPSAESTVRSLAKVAPEACYVPLLLNLRRALSGGIAPELLVALAHLKTLNVDALSLINSRALLPVLTPSLLREVVRHSHHPGCTGEWRNLMSDVQRMVQHLPDAPPLKPLHSFAAYRRYHDEVARQYTIRFGAPNKEPMDDGSPLPPPPFAGTENIIPLAMPQAVLEEGLQQENCVVSYLTKVRRGHCYLYGVLSPERATAEIAEDQPGCWRLAQLSGFKNRPVSDATREVVENWLATAHRQSVYGDAKQDPF